jgi:pimeloyl-ACP methyl ester carboxylesterase
MNILYPPALITALTICILILFIISMMRSSRHSGKTSFSSNYLKSCDSRYLRTENFDIHYIKEGNGDPVILIHGGGMWLYSYRDTIPELSRSFTVYALDMPGYGYTVARTGNPRYSLDAMADILLEFMSKLGIEQASLVGHSWGGGWSIHFSHKYPNRVDKLILIDSSGLKVRDIFEWNLLKYPILGEILVSSISVNGVRKRLESSFFHKERVTWDMVNEVFIPMNFSANKKAQCLLSRNQNWETTHNAMTSIHKPVLLIWGDSDLYLKPALANQFLKRFPNIKVVMLKKCGHSAHEEYPERVNKIISEFLDER